MIGSDSLIPCPSCGKEVAVVADCKDMEECALFEKCDKNPMKIVVCDVNAGGCGFSSGYFLMEGEAVEAWNRRAERTCRKVPGRMKYGTRMPKCSECGQSLGDDRWVYCPKCGAKAVE